MNCSPSNPRIEITEPGQPVWSAGLINGNIEGLDNDTKVPMWWASDADDTIGRRLFAHAASDHGKPAPDGKEETCVHLLRLVCHPSGSLEEIDIEIPQHIGRVLEGLAYSSIARGAMTGSASAATMGAEERMVQALCILLIAECMREHADLQLLKAST